MTKVIELLVMWLFLVAIVAIVVFWEKQPIASLWLRRFSWTSIAFALATMYAIVPPMMRNQAGRTRIFGKRGWPE